MKIGFIGLGIMGSRMAANLQKRGHSLVVYNRTRDKAEPLVAEGARWADSPAALAPQVEVIFTMLAHPDAVEEAVLGKDGFLSHLAPGQMWVDCSTVNPSFSRKMATETQARGIRFLGAPVTGSKGQAALAKLTFWVGGEATDLETCRPLLECMGNRIIHCGGQGMGASLKMVMNQLLGTIMAAFAEGLVLGKSLGLPPEVLFEAILRGPAAAPFLAAKQERIQNEHFEDADFPLRWLQKDLHLASVSAYETGVPMPLTNVAKEIYRFAIREGDGDKDFSAIYRYLARDYDVKPGRNGHPDHSDEPSNKPWRNVYAHDNWCYVPPDDRKAKEDTYVNEEGKSLARIATLILSTSRPAISCCTCLRMCAPPSSSIFEKLPASASGPSFERTSTPPYPKFLLRSNPLSEKPKSEKISRPSLVSMRVSLQKGCGVFSKPWTL